MSTSKRLALAVDLQPFPVAPIRKRGAPPDEYVRAFADSMPARYRDAMSDDAVREHAGIAYRRGASAARVEACRGIDGGTAAICVVADDRPGLLSRISAALVAHGLDVVAAQVFCRTLVDARVEAVDLFALRRSAEDDASPIGDEEVARVGEVLDALVRCNASFDAAARFATAVRTQRASTRVRFVGDEGGRLATLVVETDDGPGLLLAIASAVFRRRAQIVRSEVRTLDDGRAIDRFELAELDGSRLVGARQLEIQEEVLAAIDGVHRALAR